MKKLLLTASIVAGLVTGLAVAPAAAQGKPLEAPKGAAKPDAPAKPVAPATPATPAKPAAPKPDAVTTPTTPPPPAAAAPPAPPPPAPELDAWLKDLTKNLTCKSKVNDSPMGKGYTTTSKLTMKKELNGYFYTTKYEEAKAKGNAGPAYRSMGFIGFDPSKKQLVRTDMDGMGGITHSTSAGWENDKMVFTGKVLQANMEMKETFQKAGKEVKHTVEVKGPDGAWLTMVENTCK